MLFLQLCSDIEALYRHVLYPRMSSTNCAGMRPTPAAASLRTFVCVRSDFYLILVFASEASGQGRCNVELQDAPTAALRSDATNCGLHSLARENVLELHVAISDFGNASISLAGELERDCCRHRRWVSERPGATALCWALSLAPQEFGFQFKLISAAKSPDTLEWMRMVPTLAELTSK